MTFKTVGDLVAQLQKLPQDKPIFAEDQENFFFASPHVALTEVHLVHDQDNDIYWYAEKIAKEPEGNCTRQMAIMITNRDLSRHTKIGPTEFVQNDS